jgi:uncharacterized protein (TIGR03435 family)
MTTEPATPSLDRRIRHPLPVLASIVLALVAVASTARAQPPGDTPPPPAKPTLSAPTKPIEFDIATFKIDKSNPPKTWITIPPGGDGFAMQNRPFHDLIRFAFAKGRGGAYRISGQPAWVDSDLYDIQAKVAPEDIAEWQQLTPLGQKIAIQGFIIEYLKLKYHPDPTLYPYYALVVARNGPKGMTPYKAGDSFKTPDGQTVSNPGTGLLQWISATEVMGLKCTTERLADQLSGRADHGVLDQTGLMPQSYNFDLRFDELPDPSHPDSPGIPFLGMSPGDATASMRTAVKQLGLELKATTGPLDGMVIDHIERPPEN